MSTVPPARTLQPNVVLGMRSTFCSGLGLEAWRRLHRCAAASTGCALLKPNVVRTMDGLAEAVRRRAERLVPSCSEAMRRHFELSVDSQSEPALLGDSESEQDLFGELDLFGGVGISSDVSDGRAADVVDDDSDAALFSE